MKTRAILVAVLVVLAGCGGSVQETETTTAEPTTTTTTETTTEASADNPWNQETVTVAIDNRANESRDISPLVAETIEYWDEDASVFARYSVTFELEPDATERADLVVRFEENISTCGIEKDERSVGCAPILTPGAQAERQEVVRIEAGYSDESTVETMKHEFGHVLGVGHGEPPRPLMDAMGDVERLSKTDARNRSVPWKNSTVTVFVDSSNLNSFKSATFDKDLPHALEYFSSGADGSIPENVSVVEIEDRERADVVVTFPDEVECAGETQKAVSCRSYRGENLDSDRAFEYYTEAEIEIASIHTHTMVWHLGYWLANLLGLEGSELPSVFVDADYDERSSDWWEE